MNRRDFIKKASVMGALTTWTVTCQYEEKEHDPKGKEGEAGKVGYNWDYRVYCYERGQGEWTFSQNIKGSFASEREYMTHEEEQASPYAGWMDGGKLHFATLEEAQDFVEMHVRAKDDTNLIDHIYDIYYVSRSLPVYDDAMQMVKDGKETEIQVAHFWFNGDTGRQVSWQSKEPHQDWSKMECS